MVLLFLSEYFDLYFSPKTEGLYGLSFLNIDSVSSFLMVLLLSSSWLLLLL